MKFNPKKIAFAFACLIVLFSLIAQPRTVYQSLSTAHNIRNISPDSAYHEFEKTLAIAKIRKDSTALFKKVERK